MDHWSKVVLVDKHYYQGHGNFFLSYFIKNTKNTYTNCLTPQSYRKTRRGVGAMETAVKTQVVLSFQSSHVSIAPWKRENVFFYF